MLPGNSNPRRCRLSFGCQYPLDAGQQVCRRSYCLQPAQGRDRAPKGLELPGTIRALSQVGSHLLALRAGQALFQIVSELSLAPITLHNLLLDWQSRLLRLC